MRIAQILLIGILLLYAPGKLTAQKIGFANISLILAYMPEAKTMEENLTAYQKELAASLKAKEDSFAVILQDYVGDSGTLESLTDAQRQELQGLNQEVQQYAANAENKLLQRRQTLLEPILTKMNKAIKELAIADGYTYILNAFDGAGTSIVLHSIDSNDVTKALMDRLQIKIPQGDN